MQRRSDGPGGRRRAAVSLLASLLGGGVGLSVAVGASAAAESDTAAVALRPLLQSRSFFAAADGPLPESAGPLAERILRAADPGGLPFAVVDKRAAMLTVYRGDGRLAGSTPVLLGATPGDQATRDVGWRTQAGRLRAADRTTPAGRFEAEPGHNLQGEAVVWIDYAKALAVHRLRPGLPQERRAERLASTTPSDNRISAGCVVVPVAFYDAVVEPVLGRGRSVFYVMPETDAATRTLASSR